MIKVKGTAVSNWTKTKLFIRLNSELLQETAWFVALVVFGVPVVLAILAVTNN